MMIARETDHQRRLFVAVGGKKREREREKKKKRPQKTPSACTFVVISLQQRSIYLALSNFIEEVKITKNGS